MSTENYDRQVAYPSMQFGFKFGAVMLGIGALVSSSLSNNGFSILAWFFICFPSILAHRMLASIGVQVTSIDAYFAIHYLAILLGWFIVGTVGYKARKR